MSNVNKCNMYRLILIYQKNKVVRKSLFQLFLHSKINGLSNVKQHIIHNLISKLTKTNHLQQVNDLITIIIQFRKFVIELWVLIQTTWSHKRRPECHQHP